LTALAADTVSITIMEFIDNVFVLLVPGAMNARLYDALFYASVAGGFAIALPFALLANRHLIARGKGACPLTVSRSSRSSKRLEDQAPPPTRGTQSAAGASV
jgi:Domain of unknown function (DUF4396)